MKGKRFKVANKGNALTTYVWLNIVNTIDSPSLLPTIHAKWPTFTALY